MSEADPIEAYDVRAAAYAETYEGISSETAHASLLDFVPRGPGLALDVGAGSGRDAAWLASLGFEIVAVEPAAGMRAEGQARHADVGIRWLDDRMPDLAVTHRLGLSFDVILVSAVWMHLPPPVRARAFRKLVTLLKPGGTLLMTLRNGPDEPDRPMWPTSSGEVEALARAHGLAVVRVTNARDGLWRQGVSWTSVCLRLPDDGAGALPLLRGIILNDNKSSTYKLALLRAILRVADGAPALAVDRADEDVVDVPLGLVALHWVRQFLPLIALGLPQMPRNSGPDGLGFAGQGFRALAALNVVAQDLRIGAQFTGERTKALIAALGEARKTIAEMPAFFIRYPNSEKRVFATMGRRSLGARETVVLDGPLLATFGTLSVPGHIWRAMQRLGTWIEPVLIGEWARMTREYGDRMGRPVPLGMAEAALVWLEPARDTMLGRQAAKRVVDGGFDLRCVWTGSRLSQASVDIDHCLPWSAWPCGDLWNLLPASPRVNQHLKRDRLPSASALAAAGPEVLRWWDAAWHADDALRGRFDREVLAALPVPPDAGMADVFAALEWRRLRLRQDQQVEEWHGMAGSIARV